MNWRKGSLTTFGAYIAKSNKTANYFPAGEVLKQPRYSGMMEAVPIRRERYTLREDHLNSYNPYNVLLSAEVLGGDEELDDWSK